MNNSNGIWVDKLVTSPQGNVIVSVRLDTVINPETMCDRLDKESIELNAKMDKLLVKLDSFNVKTPQKITDATMKEILDVCQLQSINIKESFRWYKAWEVRDYEEALAHKESLIS